MRLQLKTHQNQYQATFSANITTHDIVLVLPVLQLSIAVSPVDVQCTANIYDTFSKKQNENSCPPVAEQSTKVEKCPTEPTVQTGPVLLYHTYLPCVSIQHFKLF